MVYNLVRVFVVYVLPLLAALLIYFPFRELSDAHVEGQIMGLTVELGGPAACYFAIMVLSAYLLPRVMHPSDPHLATKKLLQGTWNTSSTSSGLRGAPKAATGDQTITLTGTELTISGNLTYDHGSVLGTMNSISVRIIDQSLKIYYLLTDRNQDREPFEWSGLAEIDIGPLLQAKGPRGQVRLTGTWKVYGPERNNGNITYTRKFDP